MRVAAGEIAEGDFDLPAPLDDRPMAREVALLPDRWGLAEVNKVSRVASFRPLQIAIR